MGTTEYAAAVSRAAIFNRLGFTRFILGAPELTLAPRIVQLGSAGMMTAGGVQFGIALPEMISKYRAGDISALEIGWGAFQSWMQPFVQAHAAQRFAARQIEGIPEYTPRWRQFTEGFLTASVAEPRSRPEPTTRTRPRGRWTP